MSLFSYTYNYIMILSLFSCLFVVLVVNPIVKTFYLILTFTLSSFIMIFLCFNFLGLTYIIVYVGAIMILFLFVIMMVGVSSPGMGLKDIKLIYIKNNVYKFVNSSQKSFNINVLLSFISYVSYFVLIMFSLFIFLYNHFTPFYISFYPIWVNMFYPFTDLQTLGYFLYLCYPICLLLIGIILFIVMIGVIKITCL